MRRSTISALVVTAWLLGVAIPAGAADPALKLLLKKGIITQEEYDQALRETGQLPETPPAKAGAAPPAAAAPARADAAPAPDGDSTVDLGKGIKFGYDRGLYTQFGPQEFSALALFQFVDVGFVAEAYVTNALDRRDQGVTIFSDQEKHPVNYAFGVFNGVGINLNRPPWWPSW